MWNFLIGFRTEGDRKFVARVINKMGFYASTPRRNTRRGYTHLIEIVYRTRFKKEIYRLQDLFGGKFTKVGRSYQWNLPAKHIVTVLENTFDLLDPDVQEKAAIFIRIRQLNVTINNTCGQSEIPVEIEQELDRCSAQLKAIRNKLS